MKTKPFFYTTIAALCAVFFVSFAACGSNPKADGGPDELNAAVREASDYLNENIPAGNKIVILNVQSGSAALSDYIIDELIANTVNDKVFSVVDRQQIDAIRAELDFQWAGEVDDNSAQEIGKMLGAQTIVSGAVSKVGGNHRLRIRALEVQTAQVQGQFNRNIPDGGTIADLMSSSSLGYGGGSGSGQGAAKGGSSGGNAAGTSGVAAAKPAAPAYKIGDIGPAGGTVFYDKGNSQGGWRYLEAAPASTEKRCQFSSKKRYDTEFPGRGTELKEGFGVGFTNTQYLLSFLAKWGEWDMAAEVCDELSVNGFDDWYLPSLNELAQMYGVLHRKDLGGFQNEIYWSSNMLSPSANVSVPCINFTDGSQPSYGVSMNDRAYVRACRRF